MLTSSAFGLLTVLPPTIVRRWLGVARRADGQHLPVPHSDVSAIFWPQFTERSGGVCEPDVLLTLAGRDDALGVLVEVKYQSDMSGWPSPAEDPNVRSQLGREWVLLHDLTLEEFPDAPRALDRRALVYVTVDPVLPKTTFEIVATELSAKRHDAARFLDEAYWLSWFELHPIVRDAIDDPELQPAVRTGLLRLAALLDARKLCAFGGIERPRWDETIAWAYDRRRPYEVEPPLDHTGVPWSYPMVKA